MNRRSFLGGAASGSVLLGCRPWTRPYAGSPAPSAHELATIAAVADTFLPGDDGTPAAHDANAVSLIVDPAYGVRPFISQIVSDLDDWCDAMFKARFVDLDPARRELALEQRMGLHGAVMQSLYRPAYEGVLALTKIAFFGGVLNKTGTNYIGYPGPSTGYAPGSAAGAYASRDSPTTLARGASSVLRVDGNGNVADVRLTLVATSEDDVRAALEVRAPDSQTYALPLRAEGGDILIDDQRLPLTGGVAAGVWRLAVTRVDGGSGAIALWSLRLRTELDG